MTFPDKFKVMTFPLFSSVTLTSAASTLMLSSPQSSTTSSSALSSPFTETESSSSSPPLGLNAMTEIGVTQYFEKPADLNTYPAYSASVLLKQVLLPVVLLVGTVGNVFVLIVNRRLPSLNKSSIYLYFSALAVTDILNLWTAIFWVLDSLGFKLNSGSYARHGYYRHVVVDAVCRVRVWSAYALGQMSAWLLVSMTTHRALGILWPYRTKNLLRKRNTGIVIAVIVTTCTIFNAHVFYGHSMDFHGNATESECFFSFTSDWYDHFFNRVWVWMDIVFSTLIPFVFLFGTNTILIRKVSRSLKEARENFAAGSSGEFKLRDRKLSSMSLTLITMSVSFLLLTSPICVYMIMQNTLLADAADDVEVFVTGQLVFSLAMVLWYTNCAINFYLYCLTGSKYRAEIVRLFRCGKPTEAASREGDISPSSVGF
ncbi:lysophosphatidic acid receptor 6-like [Littorina saxatilis]|uniref:lysophosphatidic acid receptor 6-like n=1 Tax=Littorina saxatilis TaxID=31220 RepID=UPI0038B62D9D